MAVKKTRNKNGIFAAVGAATGLGNAFRFPALCVSYGAAFIFAYAAALALVCFPLLTAELAFGRKPAGRGAKVWATIARAAAVNSALIALYYGVIAAKLGSESLSFLVFAGGSGADLNGYALFALALILSLTAVYALLKGGARAFNMSGKISVCASLALFLPLAVAGIVRGGAFSETDFSCLAGGAVWADALGQALLSLSLAAGVMPAFARMQPDAFSPVKTALKITLANFAGCLLAALSTLPFITFIPRTVGVSCGISVYNQVIYALFGGFYARAAGFLIFGALTLVAVHSLASLSLPAVSRSVTGRGAIIFVALAALLSPLFLLNGMEALAACDRAACTVNAVLIAAVECLFFASQRHIRGVIGFFVRFICPVACFPLALFSLCTARFGEFSVLAVCCSVGCFCAVLLAAAAPRFLPIGKNYDNSRQISQKGLQFIIIV